MSDLLEQDACEAYRWAGKRVLCPPNLVGYSFIVKGKVGRGEKTTFFLILE